MTCRFCDGVRAAPVKVACAPLVHLAPWDESVDPNIVHVTGRGATTGDGYWNKISFTATGAAETVRRLDAIDRDVLPARGIRKPRGRAGAEEKCCSGSIQTMSLAGSPGGGEFAPGGGGGDGGGSEKPSGGKGGKAKVSKISDFTTPTSRFSEQWI